LTAAARKGRDLLAEEEAKRKEEEARTTVSELIEQYVRRRVKGRLRTAVAIESRLWRALSPVTAKFADELQRRDIRQLLDAAADQGIEREAEQRRQTIGAMFRWALSQDIVAVDPTAGLAGYDPGVPRDRVLTAREVRLLWAWLGEPEQAIPPAKILKLELLLGARCGEIGGMRTSEIDPEQWLWTLPPERSKNGRARVTPLLGIARDILRDQLAEATSCYLFTTERGTPFAASNVGAFLLNRAARLPVNKFTSHDLRRTVATMLAEKSVPLDAIASVLGHDAGTRETRILVRHYVKSGLIEQKKNVLELWDVLVRDMIGEPWALPQRTGGGPDD
jgi:integrase